MTINDSRNWKSVKVNILDVFYRNHLCEHELYIYMYLFSSIQNSENDQRVGRDLHHPLLRADPGRGNMGGAQEARRQRLRGGGHAGWQVHRPLRRHIYYDRLACLSQAYIHTRMYVRYNDWVISGLLTFYIVELREHEYQFC